MDRGPRVLARRSTGRPAAGFLALAGAVVAGAVLVRISLLGRQSYWIDELFSVHQSAGTLRSVLRIGADEVHPPCYALVLRVWTAIYGPGEAWTRSLSTLFAVVAVVVTHRGLRSVRLDEHVRWAATTATAAGGSSMVYALETRGYALLLLGAAGVTVTTLRAGLLLWDGGVVRRSTYLAWTAWSALAAGVHLFGAVLTAGCVTVLATIAVLNGGSAVRERAGTTRLVAAWVGCGAISCLPQVGWVWHGLATRPTFASGTEWIDAPRGEDVWELATTTFASGSLRMRADGFAWTSPIGAAIAGAVVVWSAVMVTRRLLRRRRRHPVGSSGRPSPEHPNPEARAAAVLLGLAAVVVAATFAVARWQHIWTLRNLIVVTPALLWGVLCLAAAAPVAAAGRRRVATAAVALLGAGLVPIAVDLAQPYKTDFRGAFGYVGALQARQPEVSAVFVGRPPPWGWQPADGGPAGTAAWHQLYRQAPVLHVRWQNRVIRSSGTQVVIAYPGVDHPALDDDTAALVTQLGASSCRAIPFQGLSVVRCD